MGRGDKRTKRGKIFAGSFGKTRPQGKKKTVAKTEEIKSDKKDKE
ncbi:MAG: 30S ribosomal protein THX [Acidobacteriota bacterium]|nr:30S ribosomal protein THX [Acidobacteriota bacterium]